MPTSEALLIIVNGNVVTNQIQPPSIRIIRERGKRVSTASFIIENGAALGLAQWNSVVIYSTDLATVYFNGFLMSQKAKKNGIRLDYSCECSSVEILLQKAIIDGSFTGTDDEILTAILANAYPDLSDFFDWSSGITPALLSDITMDFQDMNLMDALDMLSDKAGGVDYSQDYNDSLRVNLHKTPDFATNYSTSYLAGGSPIVGSYWGSIYTAFYGGASWSTAFKETTGGGMNQTTSIDTGKNRLFLHFPSTFASGGTVQEELIPISRTNSSLWVSFRTMIDAGAGAGVYIFVISAVTYDINGDLFNDGENIISTMNTSTVGSWVTIQRSITLSQSVIPLNGYLAVQVMCNRAVLGSDFDLQYDRFTVEIGSSLGPWFDGDSTNAKWLGTADESYSELGKNPLTWGSNPDAAFDLDIDSGTEIFDDFEFNFDGFDSLASVIVVATDWEDVDWIYPNNGNAVSTHFDLEVSVHPAESLSQPIIYKNTGSDGSPNWVTQTVATRQDGFGVGNVLYDLEDHWVEFQDAPPDLELSWRVTGRIEKRIRVVVTNEELKDASGIELTDTIHIEGNATPAEAYNLGQAELARRSADATYKFATYEPGLNPNDEIDITDSLQGISADTVVINRVTHTYLGGGKTKQFIEAGRYSSGLGDIFMETHNLAEHKTPIGQDTTEVTVALLVDADASILLDADGNQLLDIS